MLWAIKSCVASKDAFAFHECKSPHFQPHDLEVTVTSHSIEEPIMATATRRQFIPSAESDFSTWANHFATTVIEHPDVYEISEQQTERLQNLQDRWNKDFAESVSTRDAAKAAVRRKDEAREHFTEELRSVAGMIQSNRNVSDSARDLAGLPIRKPHRVAIPAPKTAPLGMLLASNRLEVTLMLSDTASPMRRGRPRGAAGCEIFISLDEQAPENPDAYRFYQQSTRTAEVLSFMPDQGGKPIHLLLRWVNPTGKPGPWSDPVSIIVPTI